MANPAELAIRLTAHDEASRVMGGLTGSLQNLAKVGIGAAVAGLAGLGAVLGTSVAEAMKAEEALAGLDAVLKSTGGIAGVTRDAALDLASSLQKVTRFSDEAVLEAEKVMLTFTAIGKDVFPDAIKAALDMSTVLGTDLQSSVIQIGKALQDPILGVTALRRVGVNFNETQMEMIKAMVEAGDVMGAQRFILQELQTEFGGAAEAAGKTFAGQLDILKNQISDVQEKIGFALLPILSKLVEMVGPTLTRAFEGFANVVEDVSGRFTRGLELGMDPLSALAFAFEKFLPEEIEDAIRAFIPALQDLWAWIGDMLPKALQFLSGLWSNALQPALQGVWGFVQEHVIPLIQRLAEFLGTLLPAAIDALKTIWDEVLGPIFGRFAGWLQENVFPHLGPLLDWFASQLPGAAATLADAWNTTLKPAIETFGLVLVEKIFPALDALGKWLKENLPPAVATAAAVFGWFKINVIDPLAGAISFLLGLVQAVISALQNLAGMPKPTGLPNVPAGTGRTTRALGGPVWPGGLFLVGEHGPEWFKPQIPGRIIPWPGNQLGLLEAGGGGSSRPPISPSFTGDTLSLGTAFSLGLISPTTTTSTGGGGTFAPSPALLLAPIVRAASAAIAPAISQQISQAIAATTMPILASIAAFQRAPGLRNIPPEAIRQQGDTIIINQTVEGHVLTEIELVEMIRSGLVRLKRHESDIGI